MNFLETLYKVSYVCKDAVNPYAVIVFNPNHELYRVHFPDNPITPGVILIKIATTILESITLKHLRLTEADSIKFLKPVRSNATTKIVFANITIKNKQLKTDIRIETDGVVFAKMLLTYN